MNKAEIFLGILALAVIATDIAVRLVIAPHRRAERLGELFNSLIESGPHPQSERVEPDRKTPIKRMMKRLKRRLLNRQDGSL